MKKGLLESFEERLEQYKQPVDMSDLNEDYALNGVKVKHEMLNNITENGIAVEQQPFHIEFEKRQYGNGLEGELLQELDETRDALRRRDLIEKIVEVRNQQKETAKQQLMTDIQDEQKQIKGQKEKLQTKINHIRSRKIVYIQRIAENESVLKLKAPNSKVYKAANQETTEYMEAIKKQEEKLNTLSEQIELLDNDYNQLDTVLMELDGRMQPEELAKREEERKAVKEVARQKERTSQEQEGLQTEQDETELTDEQRAEKEAQERAQTERQRISEFAENLRNRQRNAGNPKRMQPVNGQQTPKGSQENPQPPISKESPYKVDSVVVTIRTVDVDEKGEIRRPVYVVMGRNILTNEPIKIDYPVDEINKVSIEDKRREIGTIKADDSAYEICDLNMYAALKEFDDQYNKGFETSSAKDYINKIKSLYSNGKVENDIDIIYNLTNLKSADLRFKEKGILKNIAKLSQERGVAEYIRKPNILQRLFGKMKTLTTAKPEKEVEEKPETAQERMTRIQEEYEQLHNEKRFSIREFANHYQLSMDEQTKLLASEKPYFKTKLKYEPKEEKSQDTIPEEVQAKNGPIHHGMIVDENILDGK